MIRFIFRASRGYGILVPVLFFCSMMASGIVLGEVNTDSDGTEKLAVILGLCAIIASIPLWIVGRKHNRNNYDPHSFLFIQMEFWAIILPVILAIANWPK